MHAEASEINKNYKILHKILQFSFIFIHFERLVIYEA